MIKKGPNIGIVLGTRPEIIKCAPIIDECRRRKIRFFVVHTGQHYSPELDQVFFRDLKLRPPQYNLGVGSVPADKMIGSIILGLHDVFAKEQPTVVLVHGDTNSALAGAIAGHKAGIRVGHIEAGLRSFDRAMPEEINRLVVDAVSDFLFVPTQEVKKQVIKEQIDSKRVFMVGNTIVEAVERNIPLAKSKSTILKKYGLTSQNYAVLTLHRPSNVDDHKRLSLLMKSIGGIPSTDISKVIFPVHPRTREHLNRSGTVLPSNILLVDPVGYMNFLSLLSNAAIVLTDSGGIQEESCVMRVPCVTLRDNTERPETLRVGANILAKPKDISRAVHQMLVKRRTWTNPFGDGKTAKRIIDIVSKSL